MTLEEVNLNLSNWVSDKNSLTMSLMIKESIMHPTVSNEEKE